MRKRCHKLCHTNKIGVKYLISQVKLYFSNKREIFFYPLYYITCDLIIISKRYTLKYRCDRRCDSPKSRSQLSCETQVQKKCHRGGYTISEAFHSDRIAIITHEFSHLNIFKRRNRGWGYIPQKLKSCGNIPVASAYGVYASPPLLMKLINQYGGVKNEPAKD